MRNLKLFFRKASRQKNISVLTVASLGLGIAVSVLVGLWAINEFSFDRFHQDADITYRVYTENTRNGGKRTHTYRQLGERVAFSVPEIKEMCRIANGNMDVRVGDDLFLRNSLYQTDRNFFTFFTFPLKEGEVKNCLSAPNQMVIDQTTAGKWFPGGQALGKSVQANGMVWTISAVMYDIPENSHLKRGVIVPFYGKYAQLDCGSNAFTTYLKIPFLSGRDSLEARLTQLSYLDSPMLEDEGLVTKVEPLKEVHFGQVQANSKGNKFLVWILLLVASSILIISCVNFTNLFISTSFLRAKEIGVKKTHGAGKGGLMKEFYMETACYVLLSVILGVIVTIGLLPLFNEFVNSRLTIDFSSPLFYGFLLGITLFTILLSGSFPALYMTKFNTVQTLKGQFKGQKLSSLQKGFLILQFTVSLFFLISVFFIHKQVDFMVNHDLGFDKENIVIVSGRGDLEKQYNTVREELLREPSIKDVTMRVGVPMSRNDNYPVQVPGADERYSMELCEVKPNYLKMMGMEIIEGENPFREGVQQQVCVLNETAVRVLGLKDPLNETINIWGNYRLQIKGIVKDVTTKSFYSENNPEIYFDLVPFFEHSVNLYVKVQGDPREALQVIEAQWNKMNPGVPFRYDFLDTMYAQLYKSEVVLEKMLSCAMAIVLCISIAGLFAIAYYATQRRIKEIGIRKVSGAGNWSLLLILNASYVKWMVVSFVLACPLAYLFVKSWQDAFAVKAALSWWVFALSGVIAVVVAMATVSYLTWKTARINPVEALKSE